MILEQCWSDISFLVSTKYPGRRHLSTFFYFFRHTVAGENCMSQRFIMFMFNASLGAGQYQIDLQYHLNTYECLEGKSRRTERQVPGHFADGFHFDCVVQCGRAIIVVTIPGVLSDTVSFLTFLLLHTSIFRFADKKRKVWDIKLFQFRREAGSFQIDESLMEYIFQSNLQGLKETGYYYRLHFQQNIQTFAMQSFCQLNGLACPLKLTLSDSDIDDKGFVGLRKSRAC